VFFKKKAKQTLSQPEVDGVKKLVYHHNEFEFVETEVRNCLLCGRTRSGKTTTMNVLKDPCYSPVSQSIFSETQNPKFSSFAINNRAETVVQKFTINIIDSPGLFEVKDKNSVDKERTNEVIASTIAKCLENEITNIHCIIMFVTFEAGINRDDIDAMKLFLEMFGGSGVSVALCVTHADKHSDSWRKDILQQIHQHSDLSQLIEKENMQVYFMGCVHVKDKIYSNADELQEDFVNIYEMRKEMLQFIFSAKEKRMLNQMNVAKKKIEGIRSVMDIIEHNFKLFSSANDFQTQKIQETIIQHRENIAFLSQNSVFMNVPQLADKFVQVYEAAKLFKEKQMDETLKNSLLWPLKLRADNTDNKTD